MCIKGFYIIFNWYKYQMYAEKMSSFGPMAYIFDFFVVYFVSYKTKQNIKPSV